MGSKGTEVSYIGPEFLGAFIHCFHHRVRVGDWGLGLQHYGYRVWVRARVMVTRLGLGLAMGFQG